MTCIVCGKETIKHPLLGGKKSGYWYECSGCGLSESNCTCNRISKILIPKALKEIHGMGKGVFKSRKDYLED